MMAVEGYVVRFPHPERPSLRKVAMREREWREYSDDIPARSKARLKLVISDYCDEGPQDLDKSDFRFLKHYSREGTKVRMEEFKAPQVRLFGFCADDAGVSTFFVTGCDPAKKQQKLDTDRFEAAGREAVKVMKSLAKQTVRMRGKK
jgi:hypothetical protein